VATCTVHRDCDGFRWKVYFHRYWPPNAGACQPIPAHSIMGYMPDETGAIQLAMSNAPNATAIRVSEWVPEQTHEKREP